MKAGWLSDMTLYKVFDEFVKEKEIFETNFASGLARFNYLLDLIIRDPDFDADKMGKYLEGRFVQSHANGAPSSGGCSIEPYETQMIDDLVMYASVIREFLVNRGDVEV